MHCAIGLEQAFRLVEQNHLAFASHAVVTGENGDKLRRFAGNRLCVEQGIREKTAAAVARELLQAVWHHREQDAREVMRHV